MVKQKKENGYIGLWQGKKFEVYAETTYQAQQLLIPVIQKTTRKKVKGYDIRVFLCEKNGQQITQSTCF
ncbi:MAG: hypothetical protein WC451_03320 [Patescibacteria group bacterium]|jgi:hypothetical protein